MPTRLSRKYSENCCRIVRSATISLVAVTVLLLAFSTASAQWENRYTKLSDFGHHVYLEQHELPVLGHGPTDPAPAPNGRHLAFAARGWLWLLDLETDNATRLTRGAGLDSRPRWSPDGKRLAFVRDNGRDTAIIVLDLASGNEMTINTEAIELDPEFSTDGAWLYYTSGESGSLTIWRHHFESGEVEQLTDLRQVERNARSLANGAGLLYLHGNGAYRTLRVRDLESGDDAPLPLGHTLVYHLTADTHPVQRLIVYSAPIDNAYHLWTLDLDEPRVQHRLTDGDPFAMTPAFSADGKHIYFVDLDENRQFALMRIPTYGGLPEPVTISNWDLGEASGTLNVNVTDAAGNPVTARLAIVREDGYPVAFHEDATYFDPQSGRHYFYLEGEAQFTLPAGNYQVTAARGPMAPLAESGVQIGDNPAEVSLILTPLWDAGAAGYVSADHHVHLNGDGHHRSTHKDALRLMEGEDLDLLAPMSWNRWERRIDASILGLETVENGRIVAQSQEVRSHFHGHVGLLGTDQAYVPWFWGPNNPMLGDPDRSNGEVMDFAERTGAFPTYVHPIANDSDPFTRLEDNPIPLELVSDAVLTDRFGLELVCVWMSPLGNTHLWYRLLNIGQPVAAMSGTDSWVDFHRTMAAGTGRNYVRLDGAGFTSEAVLEAAAAGRGFVTTGPALMFAIGDAQPGDVISSGGQEWTATLISTTDIDVVELVVNGVVVEELPGIKAGETRHYLGSVDLPEGGWVAIRAYAGEPQEDAWPTMHARPFAHSSPVWIGAIGSTEATARSAAAADLIRAIDAAEQTMRTAYGEIDMTRVMTRFEEARNRLTGMVR
ncbi:MAG: CehA/McbA family metallohydrolase [Cyclonatronaceae bacterium]